MIPETGNREQLKRAFMDNTSAEPQLGEVYRCCGHHVWGGDGVFITIIGVTWPMPIHVSGLVSAISFFLPYDLWWHYRSNGVLKFSGYDGRIWNP